MEYCRFNDGKNRSIDLNQKKKNKIKKVKNRFDRQPNNSVHQTSEFCIFCYQAFRIQNIDRNTKSKVK